MTSRRSHETPQGPDPRSPGAAPAYREAPPALTGRELADAVYLAAWQQHTAQHPPARPSGGKDTAPAAGPQRPGTDPSAAVLGAAEKTAGTEPPRLPPAPAPPSGALRPHPSPLLHRSALYQALRPFRLAATDPWQHSYDAEETARGYARRLLASPHPGGGHRPVAVTPQWAPFVRPGVQLTVLVDESVSMLFHQDQVNDFIGLVRSSGVFRGVRVERFTSDSADPAPVPAAGWGASSGKDPGGIHIAVVLSDGIGEGWARGSVQSWLGCLAQRLPVAIIHLLDPRQWSRTGIRPAAMELTVAAHLGRAPANRHYTARPFQWPDGLPLPEPEFPHSALSVVLPVLASRPEMIHAWARFVMGTRQRTLNAGALRVVPGDTAANAAGERPTAAPTPEARVRRFRRDSSETAFQIAVDLAAVPLTEPVIAAVCQRFAGHPQPSELIEVLFSGLVTEVDSPVVTPERRIRWEYRRGVREALLSLGGRRSRIRRTLADIAAEFAGYDPWFALLRRILDDSPVGELPELDETSLRLAADTLPALESIGLADLHHGLVYRIKEQMLAHQRAGHPDDWSDTLLEIAPTGPLVPGSSGQHGTTASERVPHAPHPTETPSNSASDESSMMSQRSVSISDNFPGGSGSTGIGAGRNTSLSAIWGGDIPPRNALFTGRDDLILRLREQLRSSSEEGRMTPSVLKGMPGIGKTQLATEYLYRFRDEYDLVWWVRGGQTHQIHEAYTLLAQELDVFRDNTSINSTIHSVREALRRGKPRSRWLLIFDDVRQPDDIMRYLPIAGPGHVIITTRNLTWPEGGYFKTLPVEVFSLQESVALLSKCGLVGFSKHEAAELAEELGHMPIALRQAAAWMNDSATTIAEYLEFYRDKQAQLAPMFAPADPDYPETVITALNVSLDRLAVTNPAALQLLQVCSFFSTAPIPRSLFRHAQDVAAPPELEAALQEPNKLHRAFSDIGRYGLAVLNHRTRTVQVHRLVQQALRVPLTADDQEQRRHCAHLLLAKNDPQDTSSPGARIRYAQLLPHVWATEAWDCTDSWVRRLVLQEIYVTDLRGEHSDSKQLAEATLSVWREKLGKTAPETLRAELYLVRALRNLGERKRAYELCERVLRILTEQHGPDSEEALEASLEFVRDLRYAGRFHDSVELARDTRDRYRRILGPDDPETISASHVYAYALLLAGDHRRAADLFWEIYQTNEMILGPNNPSTLAAVDGYAGSLMEAGDYFKALRYQEDNTERIYSLFGINHRGTLENMAALAAVLRRTGNLERAVKISGEVWRETKDRFGEDSMIAVVAAANHAAALRSVNRYHEALDLVEKAYRRCAELLGEDHPHVAAINVNRAVVLRQMGRTEEARVIDERALQVLTDRLGEYHTSTLSSALNLASDFFGLDDVAESVRRDTETLARCRRALSERHPLTLLARRNLVLGRKAMNEDVAEEIAAVERLYAEVMGDQHPATLSMRRRERGNADLHLNNL